MHLVRDRTVADIIDEFIEEANHEENGDVTVAEDVQQATQYKEPFKQQDQQQSDHPANVLTYDLSEKSDAAAFRKLFKDTFDDPVDGTRPPKVPLVHVLGADSKETARRIFPLLKYDYLPLISASSPMELEREKTPKKNALNVYWEYLVTQTGNFFESPQPRCHILLSVDPDWNNNDVLAGSEIDGFFSNPQGVWTDESKTTAFSNGSPVKIWTGSNVGNVNDVTLVEYDFTLPWWKQMISALMLIPPGGVQDNAGWGDWFTGNSAIAQQLEEWEKQKGGLFRATSDIEEQGRQVSPLSEMRRELGRNVESECNTTSVLTASQTCLQRRPKAVFNEFVVGGGVCETMMAMWCPHQHLSEDEVEQFRTKWSQLCSKSPRDIILAFGTGPPS